MDGWIAGLADSQHRVVGRAQLLDLGLTAAQIKYRLTVGRLHEVLPGVYAVGGKRLTAEGRLMAVALWGGPDAFISHRSAAALWGILRPRGPIHVTAGRRRTPRADIVAHVRRLPADEVTTHDGIPATTVARTLLDIAATEGRGALVRALREAEYRQLADATALPTLIARYPCARGTAVATEVLGQRRVPGHTESELEDAFLEFLDERRIAPPHCNALIELEGRTVRVDCLWPVERVVVELDSRQAHLNNDRFESDRERDLALLNARYSPARVTWKRVHGGRDQLERDLRGLLRTRAPNYPPPD